MRITLNSKEKEKFEYIQDGRIFTLSHTGERYNPACYIDIKVTNNCQLFSLGNASAFLSVDKSTPLQKLKMIYSIACKKIMLIDIHQRDKDKLIKPFAKYTKVLSEAPYNSTNGSQMVIVLLELFPTTS